jgi:hypothetical protein
VRTCGSDKGLRQSEKIAAEEETRMQTIANETALLNLFHAETITVWKRGDDKRIYINGDRWYDRRGAIRKMTEEQIRELERLFSDNEKYRLSRRY